MGHCTLHVKCVRSYIFTFSQVHEFFNFVEEPNFYGARAGETVESLVLSLLPTPDFTFTRIANTSTTSVQIADATSDVQQDGVGSGVGPRELLVVLMETLQNSAGFHFMKVLYHKVESTV